MGEHSSLLGSLKDEKETFGYKAGASLRLDGSGGACAVLWMRRSFEFMAAIFGLISEGKSMADAAKQGYEDTLVNFHGMMLRSVFRVALMNVASREELCQKLNVDESELDLQAREFSKSGQLLCAKMKSMQESFDLEDQHPV